MTGEAAPQGGESLAQARERIYSEIRTHQQECPADLLDDIVLEALEDDAVLRGFLLAEERRKQLE